MLEALRSPRRLAALAGLTATLTLGACDEAEEPADDGGDDEMMQMSLCEMEDRADDFTVGLSKSGQRVSVEVSEAMPADPVRGDNAWTLMITDAEGNAAEGLVVDAKPWMPDHGHGSSVEEEVTEMGGGQYMMNPLNLFMAGYWEVTIDIADADGNEDEVMIGVCVE